MIDTALKCLLPHLSNITEETLWYADENTLEICKILEANPLLNVVTHRFDVFQMLHERNIKVIFSDFSPEQYSLTSAPKKILYRISKEKALVHFLTNQAKDLLAKNGLLVMSGLKNEGVKNYGDKINKILKAQGKLKKQGNAYCGEYQFITEVTEALDDQDYSSIQTIKQTTARQEFFYSKPGVFGWNKIDQGTSLLLETLAEEKNHWDSVSKKSVLDLGCGYGWIGLNIDGYGFANITGTDNNAAALRCAQKNAELMRTPTNIIASNCADTIHASFDLILCNPPFHRGFQHHQDLTVTFLKQASQHLKNNGTAFFVVNSFIEIETTANPFFKTVDVVNKSKNFKVLKLSNK